MSTTEAAPPAPLAPTLPPVQHAPIATEPAVQPEPVTQITQVASAPASVPNPVSAVVEDSTLTPEEVRWAKEIDHLWKAHTEVRGFLKLSREDAAKTRAALAKRLYELKCVLSRPGRGGAWFAFLKEQAIPRSSADRLANAHAKTIPGPAGNCPSGASKAQEPTDVVVRRYLNGLWPKLSRVLATREHLEMFIVALTDIAEKSFAANAESPVSEDLITAAPSS